MGHFELNAKQPWHESKTDRSKFGKIKPCRNWMILRFNKLDELSNLNKNNSTAVLQALQCYLFARFLTLAL